ncbi:lysylphosphatidylglycerol synthase transmembrane domain-containing protein [Azospirillum sp. SYSU D00513]|uniref:lysylphosphatidylglycerol synthase transmembrane domain-containing protein n=1 Tax=Azospirillum sp. SYSU D00513 TaxID=2812561 RepID=UPI001A96232B|nr:lysylphosphatidylglycerol synthase transmembrane domain-containing protein [Azospirillum sp. SYSU D00513]
MHDTDALAARDFRPGFPAGGTPARYLPLALKAAVTVTVLVLLLSRADWPGLAARLSGASPGLLLLAFALNVASVLLAAERWLWAAASGVRFSRWTAYRLMLASLFFGQVLPGGLGGDVVRGWLAHRAGCPAATAVTAVVLDRLLALAGVILLLFLGLPHLMATAPAALAWAAPLATLGLALAVALGLQADRLPLPSALRRPALERPLAELARLRAALATRETALGFLCSVAVHLCTVGSVLASAHALGVPLSGWDALAVVPAAIFAAALPISLNGWGAREGTMVAGLALYGVGAGEATLVSVMIGLSVMIATLPGGLLWLSLDRVSTDRSLPPAHPPGTKP